MKPNIVVIISDALRPKELSLYGYEKETDKNLKKIAEESLVFENNFASSNASDVSLTSLFSGQLPETSGFIHQHPFMRQEEIDKLRKNKFWLPIYLQKQGYKTISATPLHLWFKKGFDYFMERDDKTGKKKFLNIPFVKKILLALPSWAYSLGKKLVKTRASAHFYSCTEVINLSLEKIKNAKKPFFLFMHFTDTHYPYHTARKKNINGEMTLNRITSKLEHNSQKEYIKKRFFDIKANCLEQIKMMSDDSIIEVDRQIARLVGYLKAEKLWNSTIFIILSDHGDNFGEHDIYFCRGGLYDTSMHTPLIMHLPGIKAGRINELTQNIDIPATILDYLNDRKNIDGKSLIPLIKTGKPVREKIILSDGFCDNRTGIRTKTKKMISTSDGKCYLCGAVHGKEKEEYNLIKDPEELNNLA